MLLYIIYKLISYLITPLLIPYLIYRLLTKKETLRSIKEKLCIINIKRPKGKLLWFHAASVGELKSILPLLVKLKDDYVILLTTVTMGSAEVARKESGDNIIHQFMPLDIPWLVNIFLKHWKPDAIIFVDSELWPNFLTYISSLHKPLINLNARLSDKSFARWSKIPAFASYIYDYFDLIIASSNDDIIKIAKFTDPLKIKYFGNLKYANYLINYNQSEYKKIHSVTENRKVWVAASTHKGEEKIILAVQKELIEKFDDLLLIIIPRHPERGINIEKDASKFQLTSSLRSKQGEINKDTEVYIADTIGELGIWYKIAEIVFVGGSLIPHGGQNILEPASLNSAIIVGPHTHNFKDIIASFKASNALLEVHKEEDFKSRVEMLLIDEVYRNKLKKAALAKSKQYSEVLDQVLKELRAAVNY